MNYFSISDNALLFRRRGELAELRPWGRGIRVRATMNHAFTSADWALSEKVPTKNGQISISEDGSEASVAAGGIRAVISAYGRICYYRQSDGALLLKEYYRSWDHGTEGWKDLDTIVQQRIAARSYKNVGGDHWRISLRFEASEKERIYGMGQYQQSGLNLKGSHLDLVQKNTQASVPFMMSSLGYGLLWNNPAVGTASFATNETEFTAEASPQIDLWITCGDTPAQITEQYTEVTGRVPMMPDWAMGFWQCKLRYQSQDEVLQIARRYHEMGVPLSVIVIDFFHWTQQGEWKFDPLYFPDPAAMVRELHSMGIRLMVSIWPTVDHSSENYREMYERDLLVRANRGMNITMDCWGLESFIDPTNPEAREFLWQKAEEHYLRYGVDLFWLDEAEPEYTAPDFDLYRYYDGNALSCANEYPVRYAQAFYDGMKKEGIENPINLIRCAWAGSQKYGALVWSGDVPSTFTYLRYQLTAGLNMGMAGIAWWTADIGGFHGGNVHDPAFQELLCRWFQFGAFCPVMRLHGDRDPHKKPLGTSGGGMVASGADNEIWSYTPEMQEMMTYYIRLRESMKDYLRQTMKEAHEKGTPVIRPLFYDNPEDPAVQDVEDEYLFGYDLCVAPVLTAGTVCRKVVLPAGNWIEYETGRKFSGDQTIEVSAPMVRIPLFVREGAQVFKS